MLEVADRDFERWRTNWQHELSPPSNHLEALSLSRTGMLQCDLHSSPKSQNAGHCQMDTTGLYEAKSYPINSGIERST